MIAMYTYIRIILSINQQVLKCHHQILTSIVMFIHTCVHPVMESFIPKIMVVRRNADDYEFHTFRIFKPSEYNIYDSPEFPTIRLYVISIIWIGYCT